MRRYERQGSGSNTTCSPTLSSEQLGTQFTKVDHCRTGTWPRHGRCRCRARGKASRKAPLTVRSPADASPGTKGEVSVRYFEDFSPGYGAAAPRAAFTTDAARLDLSGQWAFRFSPTLRAEPDGFESADYEDAHWNRLAVPSHWQLQGYGK